LVLGCRNDLVPVFDGDLAVAVPFDRGDRDKNGSARSV
jgi:hypothetical protein